MYEELESFRVAYPDVWGGEEEGREGYGGQELVLQSNPSWEFPAAYFSFKLDKHEHSTS